MKEQKYVVIIGQRGCGKVAHLETVIERKKTLRDELYRIQQNGVPEARPLIEKLEKEIETLEYGVACIRSRWG